MKCCCTFQRQKTSWWSGCFLTLSFFDTTLSLNGVSSGEQELFFVFRPISRNPGMFCVHSLWSFPLMMSAFYPRDCKRKWFTVRGVCSVQKQSIEKTLIINFTDWTISTMFPLDAFYQTFMFLINIEFRLLTFPSGLNGTIMFINNFSNEPTSL